MNLIAKHTDGCGSITTVPDKEDLWRTDPAADELFARYHRVRCSGCDHAVWAEVVIGKKGSRPCGAWCWEGTGRSCKCECEGRNHGSSFSHNGSLWAKN